MQESLLNPTSTIATICSPNWPSTSESNSWLESFFTEIKRQAKTARIPSGSLTTNHRCEAPCREDQRSQSAGRGCDQEVPGTPPDIDVPDVQPPAKSNTSSLDSVAPEPSLVNPQALPNLRSKFCTSLYSIKLFSAEGMEMIVKEETSLKVSMGKGTRTVHLIMRPELVWDVILGADFLCKTKAVLNFAESTFADQQHKETNSVVSPLEKDADEICSALFEAVGITINNLDGLCSQLTQITDSERKELHSLLGRYSNMFA
ncbi:hypothetical protein TSMEX_004625 [Taenia solium]|eukprot:TsM_000967000 transcript=TsM_000967000 gene=TsM_000967000